MNMANQGNGMATSEANKELRDAAKTGDLARVQKLVTTGADINQAGVDGPLFLAAMEGQTEVIKYLLANGASVDIRNGKNSTPLMAAAHRNQVEATKLLIAAGASKTVKNNDGSSALSYAAGKTEVLAVLNRNPDEVIYSRKVGDRTMQEIFNFRHRERVTFIRKDSAGPVEAFTRLSFAELADKSQLRRAFEKYREAGGRRTEEEVFHDSIAKPALKIVRPS
jgi:ankyrin repeat protein